MCTVTWWRGPDRYELFFNRDELKTRKTASGPHLATRGGIEYLAPIDGDSGGTWIFVNAHGLVACLLNRYPNTALDSGRSLQSRGSLMLNLTDCSEIDELCRRLKAERLERYRPFHVVALSLGEDARKWTWDGQELSDCGDATLEMPVTTSSYSSREVKRERVRQFQRLLEKRGRLHPELLSEYHLSHSPERGAWSVCMIREDAETLSHNRIKVGPDEIVFSYQAKEPGKPVFGEALRSRIVISRS